MTTNAAPHLILFRSIAPCVSLVMDAGAVGMLGVCGLAAAADEFFGANGASFFLHGGLCCRFARQLISLPWRHFSFYCSSGGRVWRGQWFLRLSGLGWF